MQKHFLKFSKVFPKIACSPLILLSNNSELAAKYLPNEFGQSITTLEINDIDNNLFTEIDIINEKKCSTKKRVLKKWLQEEKPHFLFNKTYNNNTF